MFSFLILVSDKNIEIHKQLAKDVLKKLLLWKSLLFKYCELVAKILENKQFPFHRHFFS